MRNLYVILLFTLISVCNVFAQYGSSTGEDVPFNGIITHPDGKGVRARIEVVGRDKRTSSDGKGRFGLTNIEANDTLRVVVRRDTMVVAVDGRAALHIIWIEEGKTYSVKEDEKLANIGFGYVKRRESTEFSSGISGGRLRSTGCYNVIDALMICYPALHMVNGELCLRSVNSINSSSAVLVLCDGAEVNPNSINLADVKSIEVLKSSTIYGFRGVNGVVLITTLSAEDVINRSTKGN